MDQLTFSKDNRERIQAVENSFGPSGKPLYRLDRVLMGEGRLVKQGCRKPALKAFFLFNDVLVYGSVILSGRWHKNQKIIPLEDLQLEDMEDGIKYKNQWLIRTPRKSFFVSASSPEEKRVWMEKMESCRANLLQGSSCQPGSTFAPSWIPDQASHKCMRCLKTFTPTNRRHHCRNCGFVVCNSCSMRRMVLFHIHPTKKLRVCSFCHKDHLVKEVSRLRGDSTEKSSWVEDCVGQWSSDEEKEDEMMRDQIPSRWHDSQMGPWDQTLPYTQTPYTPHQH